MQLQNFPRINPRMMAIAGVVIIGVLITFAMILFLIRRETAPGSEGGGQGGVGSLPGIGAGGGGNIQGGDQGGLPGIGGSDQGSGSGGQGVGGGEGSGGGMMPDEIAQGGRTSVKPVVDSFPLAATVSVTGGVNYYDIGEQKFYTATPDGAKLLLSTEVFPGVVDVTWSPDAEEAILAYQDGSNVYYDFTRQKMSILPKGIVDPAFSASGDGIAYKFETGDANNNWIMVSSPDGTGLRAVQPTGEKGEQVAVGWSPNSKVVATYRQPRGVDREEVFFVGLEGENFRSMTVQGSLFEGMWSPDGRWMLYHTVVAGSGYIPNIWLAEMRGTDVYSQLNLGFTTWANRCVFTRDGSMVYCAVPSGLDAGAGLVPETALGKRYSIYAIHTSTKQVKEIAMPIVENNVDAMVDIHALLLSSDSATLYLKNNSGMYKMRLR